ncbi:MAG: bacteriohemerythrin [Anaerolineaceae bacterium]|nr:bacteriohemerythrin [Anaerolineaceae bacterium]
MPFFSWDESYSVGIRQFDEHHKQLVSLVNQLYDAMLDGKGGQELHKTLDSLFEYTVFHFASEEKLLLQHGYPDYQKHFSQHSALKSKVIDYRSKVEKGQVGTSVQVANFLKEWLVNHIQVEDKKYRSFLQAKGVH